MKQALLIALGVMAVLFTIVWYQAAATMPRKGPWMPDAFRLAVGFFTNFFDTLGIGSFATTTSIFKFHGTVKDEDIPGTLNVGHAWPTFAEAFIFIQLVNVDTTTLVSLIASSIVGAWLGAALVSSWSRRGVQIGMGGALLVAAGLMVMKQFSLFPGGSDAIGLSGTLLAVAIFGNFVLGALMSLGIGLFAPCMIMIALLGMDPKTAFPIMMGSCAFLMPAASLRFMKSERYDLRASIGLAVGGVPAVLVAAYLITSLPLDVLRVIVFAVVVWTAVMMLRSALTESPDVVAQPLPEGEPLPV